VAQLLPHRREGTTRRRHRAADPSATSPDATLTINRSDLNNVITGQANVPDLVAAGTASVTGDASAIHDLVELLDTFEFWFNIVTP
jgi:alkyl sulfatase BDS1-like metallo-beta-lactamase superfamily hydrolase